ncbi:LysR substrate-binding domain-containing protein [Lacrimispora defluvii]|uniref:LysR family transcriptional regulator n=1 Tax=Lacrimispora defluvii TaxID=2719233 RepID=A0ABX1VV17_9FIRM|nr:LysR family transcriptional regulator [Lacrimispora defluvii]NNJ31890.1 LysR family transcriptional regulator [Lacrimispora defluvii]
MLNFRMETFLAVCRHMNFTKAAGELNITQPAVSQHIRYLEEEYKVRLFEYAGKKISLTDGGKTLLSAAITMKDDELHLKKLMMQQSEKKRHLVFGATMTIGEYKMPEALIRFLETYPDSSVQMIVADTKELLRKLNEGEIEFALVEGFFQKKEYDFLVYASEPFAAVCAGDYKFHKEVKRVEDLLSERIFVRESGSGTRYVLERYLEGKNLLLQDFTNRVEVNSIGAIKQMTAKGTGITFLYETAVKRELEEGILRKIHLEDFELFHDFSFIWRKGSIYQTYYKELFELFHTGG